MSLGDYANTRVGSDGGRKIISPLISIRMSVLQSQTITRSVEGASAFYFGYCCQVELDFKSAQNLPRLMRYDLTGKGIDGLGMRSNYDEAFSQQDSVVWSVPPGRNSRASWRRVGNTSEAKKESSGLLSQQKANTLLTGKL